MKNNQPTVAVVRCEDYAPQHVQQAVNRGLDLLGGVERFASSGEQILLKPNILVGKSPEKCVSPHPQVFRAIANTLKTAGAYLTFGDSPGIGNPKANAWRGGFLEFADEIGVEWADFTNVREISFPEGRVMKKFSVAEGAAAADGIINISKLKTHALTRITGAIKNMFGCIPGMRKAEFHSIMPTAWRFSQMLIDLNRLLNARLCVMDGVWAMEGNGPRNGTPRPMHVLLFSVDPVALDATVCRLIGLRPELVEPLVIGQQFGLGEIHEIQWVGDSLDEFIKTDFIVNRSPAKTTTDSSFLATSFMRRFTAPRPTIRGEKCTRCDICVGVCPAQPKALSWSKAGKASPPVYDYSRCIRCYCCQEMCPSAAVFVRVPLLGQIFH